MGQKYRIFGFLDLETLGNEPFRQSIMVRDRIRLLEPWHEIIDIGIVFAEKDTLRILGEWEMKIKPKRPERCIPNIINGYPERAANGEWKDAVPLEKAIKDLFETCQHYRAETITGGQGFFFDDNFLMVAFTVCNISEEEQREFFHYSHFDTRSMAIQELWVPGTPFDPDDFSIRSGKLLTRLGIETEPIPHTAINGARKAYEVCKALTQLKQKRLQPF